MSDTLDVLFDLAEAGDKRYDSLLRQFKAKFVEFFAVPEADLIAMGRKINLHNLDHPDDDVVHLAARATESLHRNIIRLAPGQPGVHEDVRRTEAAYVFRRILDSLSKVRYMGAFAPMPGAGKFESSGGPSNWTAAFTHPDPLDPNDAQRQRTQARPKGYPYDMPVSYGSPQGTDLGGGTYQRPSDLHPPHARRKRPGDVIPYGQRGTAWEQLEKMTAAYEPGPQAPDAAYLGYGDRGLRREDEIDLGPLSSFLGMPSEPEPEPPTLLILLEPEGSEEFE